MTPINKQKVCFGINNKCNDGFQIPFFDYDNITIDIAISELILIQKTFELSTIYIIKSDNGYNAFSLDKLYYDSILEIAHCAKFQCQDFIKYCSKRGWFTLRCSNEKKLLLEIRSPYNIHKKSNAHKKFFNEIMQYHIKDNNNFDSLTEIIIDVYNSLKHGLDIDGL